MLLLVALGEHGKASGRILVIDDDILILRLLRRVLAAHEVVTARDGRAGLDLLECDEEEFDVVLCDLVMPGMDGVRFWAHLMHQHPVWLPRIVFMTGGALTEAQQYFLDEIQPPVIRKPFAIQELRACILTLVAARPKPCPRRGAEEVS